MPYFFSGFVLFAILALGGAAQAQITVTTGITPAQLITNFFVDTTSGVQVSNITSIGIPSQFGYFQIANNTPNIGMSQGIIISSGDVADAASNANLSGSTTTGHNTPSDPQLNAISPSGFGGNADAASITFNFVPVSDSVYFNFIWASEEYSDFAPTPDAPFPSTVNDVFAFFITGPGIAPNTNIALVPGSFPPVPVTINNVNLITNVSQFIHNDPWIACGPPFSMNPCPSPLYPFEYDGFTPVFTAKAGVIPCSTYTLKIAIQDVGDAVFDSAVLLEAYSFGAGFSPVANTPFIDTASGLAALYEGCSDPNSGFYITRVGSLTNPDTVDVIYTGSATNGVDVTLLPSQIIFPAGIATVILPVEALADGLAEPNETITLNIITASLCVTDTISSTLVILESLPIVSTLLPDTTVCGGNTITLTATYTGGVPPVDVQWQGQGPGATQTFTINQDTVFYVDYSGLCNVPVQDSIVVTLVQPGGPLALNLFSDTSLCSGSGGTFIAQPINGTGTYAYQWFQNDVLVPGQSGASLATLAQFATSEIKVRVNDGCTILFDSVTATVLPPLSVNAGADTTVCLSAVSTLVATGSGGQPANYSYTWSVSGTVVGTGQAISYVASQPGPVVITVQLTDNCSQPVTTDTRIITVLQPLTVEVAPVNPIVCQGQAMNFVATATGGLAPYAYSWATPGGAATGPNLSLASVAPANSGNYVVSVSDACQTPSAADSTLLTVVPSPVSTFTVSENTICAGTTLTVQFTGSATGGTPTYVWDFGSGVVEAGNGAGPFVVRFPQAGNSAIQLQLSVANDTANCVAPAFSVPIVVIPSPVASFNSTDDQCFNGGDHTFDFANTGTVNALVFNYLWEFGTGGDVGTPPISNQPDQVLGVRFPSVGTYTVRFTVQDPSGICRQVATRTVRVLPDPDAPMMFPDTVCQGFSAQFAVANPINGLLYFWFNQAVGGVAVHNGASYSTPRLWATTPYFVETLNPTTGCRSLTRTPATAVVNGFRPLTIRVEPSPELEIPNAVATFGLAGPDVANITQFSWDFGNGQTSTLPSPTIQYLEPGTYTISLTATDVNGCVQSSIANNGLRVNERIWLQVPSGFIPNSNPGAGNHLLVVNARLITNLDFKVYDRYGILVFETNDLQFEWDGTHQQSGTALPEGVYVWTAKYTQHNGKENTQTGTVTIVR